ncbi:MAG: BsuPI-related putative proteinase inhibitor [Promethearchaeota archaeon]
MERRIKIEIAVLMIVVATVPTAAYALGQYWVSQAVFAPPLSLRVELIGNQHRAGEVMSISFTLTNIARRYILLTFPTPQTFDFLVRNALGEIIYVWSWGKYWIQVLMPAHLNPWQSIQETLSWTPDTPGIYTLTGYTVNFWLGSWEDGERYNLTAQPIPFEVIG